jgi:hypothetical protein
MASNDGVISEFERKWKEEVMVYLRYCPGICLEGLRKNTEILKKDSRSQD